jgi:hypothetical protein
MSKRPTPKRPEVVRPLIVSYKGDSVNHFEINPPPGFTPEHYGLLIADLVRHVAKAFQVSEDEVWKWVDQERQHPSRD